MKYKDLTDYQLKELAKMRLKNERAKINPLKIIISEKSIRNHCIDSGQKAYFSVGFIVKSKQWSDHQFYINFTKFFPNEFLFMQEIGIDFT